MTLDDFKNGLKQAAKNGTLLTPKHDPTKLGTTVFSSFRTVLSHDLAAKLESFIASGKYSVTEYENKRLPNSPLYFEITPDHDSGFTVPASGVTANSVFSSTVVDQIVAVSGHTQGWHLFGENSQIILTKLTNGDLGRKII